MNSPATLFFRLLAAEDKENELAGAVAAARAGRPHPAVYAADPASFARVPGSPFAYWVSEALRRKFQEFPPFEGEGRTVKQGLATADDFRFVRAWWEVPPSALLYVPVEVETLATAEGLRAYQEACRAATFNGKRWVPFAKGGAHSPYYADLHLVVNWERDGEEIKQRVNPETGKPYSNVWQLQGTERNYFFRPGLTWPRRTQRGLNCRVYPSGCIFADKGPVAFGEAKELSELVGVMNSKAFRVLVSLQMAFGSYEVGVICRTPVPNVIVESRGQFGKAIRGIIDHKRSLDTANETSHIFLLPALLQVAGGTLAARCAAWEARVSEAEARLAVNQREIDEIAFRLYGIAGEDRRAVEETVAGRNGASADGEETEEEEGEAVPVAGRRDLAASLVSYAVGCAFGRWDVRLATGERKLPELPGPFAPLPPFSPGMLQPGSCQDDYPIEIAPDGLLVDDPDHPLDVVRGVRDVLESLFPGRSEAVEEEACALLGVRELRDYFRDPRGFFTDHIKRYSQSRRKAPIYWLLQSPKKSYGLWLYYHRLDRDLLAKALSFYVEPKIRLEEDNLAGLRARQREAGPGVRLAREAARAVERQETLLIDLLAFRDRLKRAADLHLTPDLNDGVILNIAPLWELVPWKEPKNYWEDLLAGKYQWSSISRQLNGKQA